ncbi:carnitine/acyl carnitine carrier [Coprinopsis marcescibilis]|uniref:Carnitine/acyl carnitine carrier n=1 Tax=Coprinopsis marcescibilis TaxID=230819 RepID=A0A5C3LDF1_COPMA|nr:carnitine/acyl carnitine carrier [Coprinopsis marcescibilis]
MRWARLPVALAAVLLPVCTQADSQVSWSTKQEPTTSSTTLVDALGADPDYLSLLKLVQRARLVPTLNRLNGSTFFAPTNDAIKRYSQHQSLWSSILEDDSFIVTDNIQYQLRQQLFYHLLNYTLPTIEEAKPQAQDTLHFPSISLEPPSREPPPNPPWMPIPGGSLGGKPQRLRVSSQEQNLQVGVDAFGKLGANVVKGRYDAGNGVLLGIDKVLEPPPDLAKVVASEPSTSYFTKILGPEILQRLNSTANLTLFLPVNDAWNDLDPYERLYLESEFASDDLNRILNMHAVVYNNVKWSDSFKHGLNLTSLDGTNLEIVVNSDDTTVSKGKLIQPDIYASNGVLHTVSSLLIPPNTLQITPEKYLLALNCTKFISLLRSVDLRHLINDTSKEYTILAPNDDIFTALGESNLPEQGSDELKRLLQYHFVPGKWTPKELEDGLLLETELVEDGLGGSRQIVPVDVGSGDPGKKRTIRFGGVGVIHDTVQVNNTVIYFISRPLAPPADPLDTALPDLELSSFLAAVLSSSQADTLRKTPKTTLFIPYNTAFQRLGVLVSNHLLSPSAKQDLENVLLHHTLDSVEYASALAKGSQHTFSTLEGSDVKLEKHNGTIYASASGGWAGMRSELVPKNVLTKTGVIHTVSDILLPRTVDITIGKLLRAAKGSTMATLVNKAGFDWILNGTRPPEDAEWARSLSDDAGWTLLCPPDDAFKDYNLTQVYADVEGMKAIVSQHIVPVTNSQTSFESEPLNNNQPLVLDEATYSTVRSSASAYGDLVFQRNIEDGQFVVGIKGARGTNADQDWARVLSWGRSTTGSGTGGVIQIDRLLVPYQPKWWVEYGGPIFVGILGTERKVEEKRVGSAAESAKSFIAGGVGGVCAVLVGHPFDLTKTRLQTAPAGTYTGAVDVVKKAVAHDGLKGLYRGVVPPLLGVTPIFAVSFWAYDSSKKLILAATPNRTSQSLSLGELAAAGFLSAVPTTLITAPVERAKVLLQTQGQAGSEQRYKGVVDVMKHLYREGGMKSIFRGTGATLARDGPGSAAYFAAYEITKKALTPAGASPADLNLGAVIVAGGTAGVAMWAIAIPPDVLKSRLQSAPNGTYSGIVDCARKTIARDGVAALWKGFGPAMARAFPANAATFLGVEASRKLLDGLF